MLYRCFTYKVLSCVKLGRKQLFHSPSDPSRLLLLKNNITYIAPCTFPSSAVTKMVSRRHVIPEDPFDDGWILQINLAKFLEAEHNYPVPVWNVAQNGNLLLAFCSLFCGRWKNRHHVNHHHVQTLSSIHCPLKEHVCWPEDDLLVIKETKRVVALIVQHGTHFQAFIVSDGTQ